MPIRYVFQFRRLSSTEWTLTNPVLKPGEPGFETDTNRLKIGNGVLPWTALPYQDTAIVDDISETITRVDNLEEDLSETTSTVENISAALPGIVPTGVISQFAGTTAPSGYLLCTGQQVAIASYPELYAVLGTTYGALTNGSGSSGTTHFRLPDLRGRVPLGSGTGAGDGASGSNTPPSGTTLTPRSLGQWGGAQTHLLSAAEIPAHSHPNSLGGTTSFASTTHTHGSGGYAAAIGATNNNIAAIGYVAGGTISGAPTTSTYTVTGGIGGAQTFNHYTPVYGSSGSPSASGTVTLTNADNTGGGGAHNNVQPFMVVNYIIKT